VHNELPITHSVDVRRALDTLGYCEMLALSEMYERWALFEENISPDWRTKLIQWSADYEQIAEYAGEDWRPDGIGDEESRSRASRAVVADTTR
jgi:hypothetical protein